MRIIAYYTTWSIYGRNYSFKSLPIGQITDVTLAFASPNSDGTLNLEELEKLNVADLKEIGGNNLFIGIAIGGWGTCRKFVSIISTERCRMDLIDSCEKLVQKYDLNYLEIDWEYPTDQTQVLNFKSFLQDLRIRIKPSVQLRVCIPCFRSQFSIREIINDLDFVVLMGYDFYGEWSEKSGHHSALFPNISSHVEYLNDLEGVSKNKIILGCPLYARTFANCNGLDEAFSSSGIGSFTEKGCLDYNQVLELCDNMHYDSNAVSYYAKHNGDFMTFDGPESIKKKCKWIREQGLAGMAFWHAASDGHGFDSLINIAANSIK